MRREVAIGVLLVACACVDQDPMQKQGRPSTYRASRLFNDGRAMRPIVPGTVSQSGALAAGLETARTPDGPWVESFPIPVTRKNLEEGRESFEIVCATCHGVLADGDSMVGRKLTLRHPPRLTSTSVEDRGRLPWPTGYYFEIISQGYGLMPAYADVLSPTARWEIIEYLSALSLSQNAALAEAPPAVQSQLQRATP